MPNLVIGWTRLDSRKARANDWREVFEFIPKAFFSISTFLYDRCDG